MVKLIFIQPGGEERTIDAEIGDNLMQVAIQEQVEGIEASCGGSMVCGTCHVILDVPSFEAIGGVEEAERDMIECGMVCEPTSRLSCQITVNEGLEGAKISVASEQG